MAHGKLSDLFGQLKECVTGRVDRRIASQQNNASLHLLVPCGIVVTLAVLLIQLIITGSAPMEYYIACGAFIYLEMMVLLLSDKLIGSGTVALYVVLVLIMLVGTVADSVINSQVPAYLFLIMLLALPLLILDTPWHIFVLIAGFGLLFLFLDARNAPPNVFRDNLILVVCGMTGSIALSARVSNGRIHAMRRTDAVQMQADHDALTGLYNNGGGTFLISGCLAGGMSGTFMIMDVDNFKQVNDTYGHKRGDEILVAVADRLKTKFKSTDIVMRMGGDEFVVYAVGMVDENVVTERVTDLVHSFHDIILDESTGKYITASIGCLINDGSYPTYDSLYHGADRMLYKVKEGGKDNFQILSVSYHA